MIRRPLLRTVMRRRLTAEFLGTFALVFAGTGAAVVHELTGAVTPVGVALTFGLVVLALIYALGEVSGAHFNPAATLRFVLARRFPVRQAGPCILVQMLGACAASLCLRAIFRTAARSGRQSPAVRRDSRSCSNFG
jgi:aquaporin NIP